MQETRTTTGYILRSLAQTARVPAIAVVGSMLLLQGCGGTSGSNTSTNTPPPTGKTIATIQITGQPVLVFDHTKDQQQPLNIPDAQITAWKEADGTVNLMVPHYEAYRMRGPDLMHLTIDPKEIYSSTASGSEIPEDLYNYHHWLMGPYSLDGKTFYSLTHSEWYACLLNNDCDQSPLVNGWENSINSMVSSDGGASWSLNEVNGNHVVAHRGFHWTGSTALANKIYLYALNHSGMFQPTRVIKEGTYYYAIAFYTHRDFTQVDPTKGMYQAPIDANGYALLRTDDVSNPNNWQVWAGGSTYQPVSNGSIAVFLPLQNGVTLNAPPPQIIFDTVAQCYILIHTINGAGSNAVYFMTTKSLANPVWSDSNPIGGTSQLLTDPGGPQYGFNDTNYPSILDNSSPGFNFEFTSGAPILFWSTFPAQYGGDNLARDIYQIQLSVTYH